MVSIIRIPNIMFHYCGKITMCSKINQAKHRCLQLTVCPSLLYFRNSLNIYPNTLLGYLICGNSKMFNIIFGTGKVMLRVAHVSFPPFTLLCGLRDLDPKDNDDLINSERAGRRVGDAVGANIINNYELKK